MWSALDGPVPLVMPEYCERNVFGFELVNTASNCGFWIAAWLAYRSTRGASASRFLPYALTLLWMVGLCSGLFHAFRTPALLVLDAAPLYVLVLSLGYRALALAASRTAAMAAISGVVVAAFAANALSVGTPLHVASRHGVAVLAFALMVTWIRRRHRATGDRLLVAVALYAIALAAKIVDLRACALLPVGTHFVWHFAGAAAAFAALRAVLVLERTAHAERGISE